MVANCTKFEPNCFDKGKCKNCYKPKEQHSADVLEQAKVGHSFYSFSLLEAHLGFFTGLSSQLKLQS